MIDDQPPFEGLHDEMSDREPSLFNIPDLRHKVRRLNWFHQSLTDAMTRIGQRYGVKYSVDDRDLRFAFFAWASRFEVHRREADRNRRDFAVYAGGLMLFELLSSRPARYSVLDESKASIQEDSMTRIARFWPDGFLYTNYCLSIVNMVLEQDFHSHSEPPPELTDLRVWESFRENLSADPRLAVAFFDVFMGVEPNWEFPESFRMRPAVAQESALPSAAKPKELV